MVMGDNDDEDGGNVFRDGVYSDNNINRIMMITAYDDICTYFAIAGKANNICSAALK